MSESIKNTIKKYFSKYKISQDYIIKKKNFLKNYFFHPLPLTQHDSIIKFTMFFEKNDKKFIEMRPGCN